MIEFEDGLLLIVDAQQLTHNLRSKLRQFLDIESAIVYLANANGVPRDFREVAGGTAGPKSLPAIPADSKTANWLRVNREMLWFEPDSAVTQYLGDELGPFREAGVQLAFPLVSMDRLIGLVFLRYDVR